MVEVEPTGKRQGGSGGGLFRGLIHGVPNTLFTQLSRIGTVPTEFSPPNLDTVIDEEMAGRGLLVTQCFRFRGFRRVIYRRET